MHLRRRGTGVAPANGGWATFCFATATRRGRDGGLGPHRRSAETQRRRVTESRDRRFPRSRAGRNCCPTCAQRAPASSADRVPPAASQYEKGSITTCNGGTVGKGEEGNSVQGLEISIWYCYRVQLGVGPGPRVERLEVYRMRRREFQRSATAIHTGAIRTGAIRRTVTSGGQYRSATDASRYCVTLRVGQTDLVGQGSHRGSRCASNVALCRTHDG